MGRTECNEEFEICEHADNVLSLAGEINRKENQVKREQRLRHEIGLCLH